MFNFPDVPISDPTIQLTGSRSRVTREQLVPIYEDLPEAEITEVITEAVNEARGSSTGVQQITNGIDEWGRRVQTVTRSGMFGSKKRVVDRRLTRGNTTLVKRILKLAVKKGFAQFLQTATRLLSAYDQVVLAATIRNEAVQPPRGSLYGRFDPRPIGLYRGQTAGTKVGTLYG